MQLRAPKTDLPEIVGRITDGIFALDTDGHCSFMNQKAAGILHIDPQAIIGRSLWPAFPDNAGRPFYKACQNAMAKQQYQCLELTIPSTDRWMEYHIHPSPTGLSILFREITERKMAEEELKKVELRYRALIEQASDAIMITDNQGNFLDVNPTLCKLFGYTKEELLTSNINNLIDPDQLKNDPIQMDILRTGQPILRERRMMHKDGTIIEVEANVKMIPDGRILAIARNITERKRLARQLQKEKEISESIINSLPGVFFIRELHGKILRWNKHLETVSGYNAEEIAELKELHFIQEKDKERIRERLKIILAEGRSTSEVIAVAKDGSKIPFFITSAVVQFEGKTCMMFIGLDISERKRTEEELHQANEQLHHLSAYLQNVREEERKAIAREIHDELGQQLTGLKMDISWAMKKCKTEDLLYDKLAGMNDLTDHTIATIRRISSELRPSILDDLGLTEALDWQSTEFEKRYHMETRFRPPRNELNISSDLATGFFRIYQESLTNVARHAKAKKVQTSLERMDGMLVLRVSDDGIGFDTATAATKSTFGLLGIKERTLMMGGNCDIFSSPGKGTTIMISVPLDTDR